MLKSDIPALSTFPKSSAEGSRNSPMADGVFVCKLCEESFFGVLGSRGPIFQENMGWTCCNCPAKLSEEGFCSGADSDP